MVTVFLDHKKQKTIHIGSKIFPDYTNHKNIQLLIKYNYTNYINYRIWTTKDLLKSDFWTKWILWSKPTIEEAIFYTSKRFNITIYQSKPPILIKNKYNSFDFYNYIKLHFRINKEKNKEITKGAHVILADNGKLYKNMLTNKEKIKVVKSEYYSTQNYILIYKPPDSNKNIYLLFGMTKDPKINNKLDINYSWFQIQNNPYKYINMFYPKNWKYLNKIYSSKNNIKITSQYTENNPLLFLPKF